MNRREFIKSMSMAIVAIHFQPTEFFTPYTPKRQFEILFGAKEIFDEYITPAFIEMVN